MESIENLVSLGKMLREDRKSVPFDLEHVSTDNLLSLAHDMIYHVLSDDFSKEDSLAAQTLLETINELLTDLVLEHDIYILMNYDAERGIEFPAVDKIMATEVPQGMKTHSTSIFTSREKAEAHIEACTAIVDGEPVCPYTIWELTTNEFDRKRKLRVFFNLYHLGIRSFSLDPIFDSRTGAISSPLTPVMNTLFQFDIMDRDKPEEQVTMEREGELAHVCFACLAQYRYVSELANKPELLRLTEVEQTKISGLFHLSRSRAFVCKHQDGEYIRDNEQSRIVMFQYPIAAENYMKKYFPDLEPNVEQISGHEAIAMAKREELLYQPGTLSLILSLA